ncbi:MAG TPA: thiamine-phosphate kinase, partial [Thauera sp.]|nr:thiamine-phosphate kinase [Thauera sp.]
MPSEFDLIRRHFTRPTRHTDLAVGDDAALLHARPGMQLAVSNDMLVSGTHFFADTDPEDLGWKTLAVNVSDLAAMGATPRWAFLALALPGADEAWIAAFARGFFACADAHGVDLAGGDTTRGPLTLSVTIIGEVPQGEAITRAGGRAGDDLWVSGQPGMAALGLAALRGEAQLATAGSAAC